MASVRKKALEEYAKSVEGGNPLAEDFVGKSENPLRDALRARNLAEESLAQKVLDNTGIPIPDKTSSWSRKEDFLNQILKERYPELKPNVSFKEMDGNVGEYVGGKIFLNKNLANTRDIQKLTSDVLHEGAHGYDEAKDILPRITQDDFNREMRKLKASGFDLKNADPAQVYEMIAKKHHAQIPDLREGTFGLGALKSYLKSGTFKGMAPVLAKGAAVGAGGLASLAAEASDAEEEGSSAEQAALLRDIDQRNREKKMLKMVPEQNKAIVEKKLEDQRLGLRRSAIEDLLKK
jgi:hypothetical protein